MFVADDPVEGRWPARLLERGALVLGAIDDVYAPLFNDGPDAQIAALAEQVERALLAGYSGIRLAADSTTAVLADLERWLAWEAVGAEFIATNPVTGLCTFDVSRLARFDLDQLASAHPMKI